MKMTTILKKNEGSVVVAALLILVLLTIIGISATTTSNVELQITSNAQLHKMAFYAAESGWQHMADAVAGQYLLTATNNLNGTFSNQVSYAVTAERYDTGYPEGWEAQQFKAYDYSLESTGTAPRNSTSQITVGARKIFQSQQYH